VKSELFERRWRDGFSLIEALIAIVIAALLAAVLTRVVGNTRMNASKIRQLVEMMALNDTLREQTVAQRPGITEGRAGDLVWRTTIEPIDFTAVARRVLDRRPNESRSPVKSIGLQAEGDSHPSDKKSMTQENSEWVPFHVTIVVASQSGRRYTSDTITIGPLAADQ
jgi:prepilin-type N-terminal cleavage/methylation domain-containing protein